MTFFAKLLVFVSIFMGSVVAIMGESPPLLVIDSFRPALTGQAPSSAQIFILVSAAAALFYTALRNSRPSVLSSLPWLVLAGTWILPILPGIHSSYPPTRFLMIVCIAVFWAESRQWQPKKITTGVVLSALTLLCLDFGRSYLLYKKLAYGYDLAHVLNLLENTMNGRFLFSDYTGASILSHHLFLSLSLLAPVQMIFASAFMPQMVQILVMGISAFVVGAAASRRYGEGPGLAALVVLLLHPAFQGQILHEMDPGVLGMLGVAIAIWGFVEDNLKALFLGTLLAILSKEHFAAAGIVAGFLLFWTKGRRSEGVAIFAMSIIALVGFVAYAMSLDSPFGLKSQAALRFGDEADALARAFSTALTPPKVGYLLHILIPTGFLCLASPLWLLPAAAEIVIVVSSTFPMHKLASHYAALLLPFLAMATAAGITRASSLLKISKQTMSGYVLASSIIAAIFSQLGPVSHNGAFYDVFFETRSNEPDEVRKIISEIPGGSVGVLGYYRTTVLIPDRQPAMQLGYIDTMDRIISKDYVILDHYEGRPPVGYVRVSGNSNTHVYKRKSD